MAVGGMLLALVAGTATTQASSIYKANNNDDLDLAASWTNGVVPGPSDAAVWNSTVTGPNSALLGSTLGWNGLQILNPGGAVAIGATATNANAGATLTLGAGGIDMSAASQSLTLDAPVALATNALQSWRVGNGQTLSLTGPFSRSRSSYAQLQFDISSGTINIPLSSISGDVVGGATNLALYFSTLNGTDVGDVDSSGTVAPAATVMNSQGLYYQNTAGGDVFGGNNNTAAGESAGAYLDVVNGNPSGDDVDLAGVRYIGIVRFNTHNPYKNDWVFNVGSQANETADPGSTYLMTTNVGAQNVIIEGSADVFRWNNHIGNDELILNQRDTAGTMYVNGVASQRVTGNNGVLTKTGAGRVVWNANLPNTGPINILGGELMLNSPSQASSVVTVGNGATLSGATTIPGAVAVNGGTIHPGSTNGFGAINVGGGLTLNADSTLAFYSRTTPMDNTNALLNVTGGLTVNGPITVSIIAGFPSVGEFPLVHWTNAISSAMFANFSATIHSVRPVGGYLTNNTANQTIDLVVTNVDEPIKWAVGNGIWDTQTANWVDQLGASTTYVETNESGIALSDSVLFDDTASGASPVTITLNSQLTPASTLVNNASKEYVFTGVGDIGGFGTLTKSGSGTLLLESSNAFTGGININGGIVNFSSLDNLGAGAINFGGGTLQFASGNTADISTRTVTFNTGGGTIDAGGNTLTFANPIGNDGAGGLTLTGGGSLTLNGTNDYYGDTVVNQGTLALGANTYLPDSAAIIVNSGATLDTATSGVGLSLDGAVNQTLAGTGTVNGNVTAPTSTALSPATSGTYGTLALSGNLTLNGGALDMDISSSSKDLITVSGNLALNSGTVQLNVSGTLSPGTYTLIQYSGTLSGAAGNLALSGFSQAGAVAYLDDSVAGQINLVVSPSASDNLTWSGSGSSWDLNSTMDWLKGTTPWAFTNGDTVTFDDSASGNPTVALSGALQPALVTVNNSTIPTYTFSDNGGKISGKASLVKEGTGTLIMETANTYTGPTTVKAGTLQIGNGGSTGGDIGTGNVTNNGALVFAQGDGTNHFVDGVVSGTGSLTMGGNGTVILANNNTYSGATTITNGTLQVGNGGSTGSLGSGTAVTDDGTLAINKSGTSSFPYNVSGSGGLVNSGPGTVSLAGNLTYQGNTYVNGGVVKITANNQLPSAATVSGSTNSLILNGGATAGGTFDLNGFNQTVNALSGVYGTVAGIIDNAGGAGKNTLTIDNTAGVAMTYSGHIYDNTGSGGVLALDILGVGSGQIVTIDTSSGELNHYSGGTLISNAFVSVGSGYNADTNSLGTGPITLAGTKYTALAMARAVLGSTAGTTPFDNDIVLAPNTEAQIITGARPYGFTSGTVSGPASSEIIWNNHYVRSDVSGNWTGFYGKIEAGSFTYGNLDPDFRLGGGESGFNGFPNARVELMANGSPMGDYTVYTNEASSDMYSANGGQTYYFGELSAQPGTTIGMGDSTIIAGGLGTDAAIASEIDSGNIVKDGTGTLTLDGGSQAITNVEVNPVTGFGYVTNVSYAGTNLLLYTGYTTVSNGVLALVAPSELTNSTPVTLASSTAVLDASAMGYISNQVSGGVTNQFPVTNSLFEVVSGQTFGGIGTLRGRLLADNNSIVDVGLPTGSLTVTSNAELAGTVTMNVNASDTNNSELMAQSITVDSTASLVVTNLGPEQAATFQLFNHPVSFSSVSLPALTGTNSWVNNLSKNGSITMVAPPPAPPTPPTPTITHIGVSGTTLSIMATNGAINGTFELLESTNLATPLTNWVPVLTNTFDGSGNLNLSTNIVNPAVPQEFYLLSQ